MKIHYSAIKVDCTIEADLMICVFWQYVVTFLRIYILSLEVIGKVQKSLIIYIYLILKV